MNAQRRTIGWLLRRVLTVMLFLVSAVLIVIGALLLLQNPDPASVTSRVTAGVGVDALVLGCVVGALTLYAVWPRDKQERETPPSKRGPYR